MSDYITSDGTEETQDIEDDMVAWIQGEEDL